MVNIIADSASDITLQKAAALGIEIMPLSVSFGDEEFKDGIDITAADFYVKLAASKALPVTSQVNPDAYIKKLSPYKGSANEAVIITIGSQFSGTYQSACIAKQELGLDNVYIVDSEQVTIGIALLIYMAVKYKNDGLSAKEIKQNLDIIKQKVAIYAAVDTLTYLHRGGRLSATKALVGTLIGVKPVLKVKNGEIIPFDQKRGFENASDCVIKNVTSGNMDTSLPIAFAHANSEAILNAFKAKLPQAIVSRSVLTACLGPVIGTHVGPNAVAIAFFEY